MINKKVLRVALIYVSIIIGAGFASGQELLKYFVTYGNYGFLGIILTSIIFSVLGWWVLEICYIKKYNSYNEFIYKISNKSLAIIIEFSVVIFMFVLFSTMLSGGGATLNQMFNIPLSLGIGILGVICFFIFLFDLEGILEVNTVMAPIMIIGGIFVGIYIFLSESTEAFVHQNSLIMLVRNNFIKSSIIYASYNILTAVVFLSNMNKKIDSKNTAKWGGIIGGSIMGIIGIFITLPLFISNSTLEGVEIPMLYLVHNNSLTLEYLYFVILIMAILTTALANGFSVIQWIYEKYKIDKLILKTLVVCFGIVFAHIGFSTFVTKVYPIFGILGFVQIILIVKYFIKIKFSNSIYTKFIKKLNLFLK